MKRNSGRAQRVHGRRGFSMNVSRCTVVVVSGVLFAVAVFAMALSPSPAHASPFADVPAGHWTYGALEQLSAAGLIDGYPPGFFSGARRLTRYEMALSLAGALERLTTDGGSMAAGGSMTANGSRIANESKTAEAEESSLAELIRQYNEANPDKLLGPGESELLRAGVVEFKPELEVLGYAVPAADPWHLSDTRWRLDATIGGIARDLLQRAATQSERRTVGPGADSVERGAFGSSLGVSGSGDSRLQAAAGKDGLSHIQAGTAIARIGSTILYVGEYDSTGAANERLRPTIPALDGTIHLSGQSLPGTGLAPVDPEGERLPLWQVTETWTGVDGVAVAPNVSLSGERARRSSAEGDAGATQVHAKVLLGDVSIDGKLRSVEPGFVPAFPEGGGFGGDAFGLGVTVRLGDVFLSTGRDIVQRKSDTDSEYVTSEHVTSLMLEYSLAEVASFRAGWQSVSDTRERTSVDVNVPVPQGAIHLGLAYEGERESDGAGISMTTLTIAGLDLRLRDNAEARAAFSVRDSGLASERTTSLGLRYSLNAEAALLLGYKLIDFAVDSDRQNVTTAEFSIRF